jgi:UDP-N-acetylglucosamine--N-acetylmuramyl-(pentapeptide) pyrophosphoryl-undecaprenol N-acetylglucosamine transferase
MKVIVSGGGTGGHIFPAIAIANAIKSRVPDADILFVGAEGRMEMEKVPAAGFKIVGLPIVGIQRRLTWRNLLVPFRIWQSLRKARALVKEFKPDLAIGVGGYASGPMLRVAASMGVPTLIQEQNSYAGITNKILASKASVVCVAYEEMEAFFPKEKIVLTGNPVRTEVASIEGKRPAAEAFFSLAKDRKTILVIGGSLGARTINEALARHVSEWIKVGFQVIWQTGKSGYPNACSVVEKMPPDIASHIKAMEFIREMDMAYAAADIIVSRAGAMSISELCLVGKPVIFVPSPHVAEDHQSKNAMALVTRNAGWMLRDAEAVEHLGEKVMALLEDKELCKAMSANIRKLAMPDATDRIASIAIQLARPS